MGNLKAKSHLLGHAAGCGKYPEPRTPPRGVDAKAWLAGYNRAREAQAQLAVVTEAEAFRGFGR